MANADCGKLATVDFAEDGSDTEQAVSLLASGAVSMPQFTAWSRERDTWLGKRAGARAAVNSGELKFKVSGKGAVSVYGLNARFPVTLYGDQWARLISQIGRLEQFIDANKSKLSLKSAA